MKFIVKNSEPRELIEHRATPGANFDGSPKEVVRNSLIEEQRGVCAYCLSRISNEWVPDLKKFKTEIEHYLSQDSRPDLSMTYTNMLGVCNGNDGQGEHKLHCDKSKDLRKNKARLPLTLNPLDRNCEDFTFYTRQGFIDSDTPEKKKDIEVLNLNEQTLVNNRKAVIEAVYKKLIDEHKRQTGHQTGNWKSRLIRQELRNWSDPIRNQYREFCQTAIYFLNKELAKVDRQ